MMQSTIAAVGKDFFMPQLAPLVILAFLGTAAATVLALIATLAFAAARRARLARWFGAAAVLLPAGYFGVLLLFSAASSERVLQAGDQKHFCEADCHIAYSLASLRRAKTLGAPGHPVTAAGEFTVVTVETWFDERTIGPHRGNAPLTPNPREVRIVDASGRTDSPSAAGAAGLAAEGAPATPLDRPLAPGESYLTTLAFDLPADARDLRLLIADTDPITRILIGHENSLGHKKIYFGLHVASNALGGLRPSDAPEFGSPKGVGGPRPNH